MRLRLGADVLHLATAAGAVVAAHRVAPAGAGRVVRDAGHVVALEKAMLSAFSDAGRASTRPAGRRQRPAPKPPGCKGYRPTTRQRGSSSTWSPSPSRRPLSTLEAMSGGQPDQRCNKRLGVVAEQQHDRLVTRVRHGRSCRLIRHHPQTVAPGRRRSSRRGDTRPTRGQHRRGALGSGRCRGAPHRARSTWRR